MKFSVIIPVYNKAQYIEKAINSVLSQTFTNYELVIVDDGSKDNSAAIAEKAIAEKPNCKLLRQENAGVSMARNNGVAASQGEYLCFLDADDWWEPTFLEEMSRLIEEFPEAGIYGANYTIVNETKHKTRVAPIGVDYGFNKGYINYCQVYAKTLAMPLTSSSVAIHKIVFDEFGGFPQGIKLGEDFLLWIRIALKYKVAFLNKPLAFYNQDVDTSNRGVGKFYKTKEHFLWHMDFLAEEEKNNADYKQVIDRLRAYDLQPYYFSCKYHKETLAEIKKIEKKNISQSLRRLYSYPLIISMAINFARCMLYKMIQWTRDRFNNLSTEKWEVGIVEGGLEEILNGRYKIRWLQHDYHDRWFADPFILDVDENNIVLLVEEFIYDKHKGRIAELVVDRNTMQIVKNRTLLEKATHLSFPAIHRDNGRVYVYPENSAECRLDLYEYKDGSLSYVSMLSDEPLTDAVITNYFNDNRIYATKMPTPNGNVIGLYRGESMFKKFDFCRNIQFYENDARMAGSFFEYKGEIYKPSQDCNVRYGKAIKLYKTVNGIDFYLHSVYTSKHPKLREGMHTINSFNGFVVVDVVGYKYPLVGRIIKACVLLKKKFKQ